MNDYNGISEQLERSLRLVGTIEDCGVKRRIRAYILELEARIYGTSALDAPKTPNSMFGDFPPTMELPAAR